MRELDSRAQNIMKNIDEKADDFMKTLVKEKDSIPEEVRRDKLKDIQEMFNKAKEYGDDKVQLAIQTYELVDKHIRRLDSDLARFEGEIQDKTLNARSKSEETVSKRKFTELTFIFRVIEFDLYMVYLGFGNLGGRKKAKDTKVAAKKKRNAPSSDDETRVEAGGKAQKNNKKQKVNHEKEGRKTQKVNHFHSSNNKYTSVTKTICPVMVFPPSKMCSQFYSIKFTSQ